MKMNKENLLKLADYLLNGSYRAEFDMSLFTNKYSASNTCGSVGCAVGHMTLIGFKKGVNEGWFTYSERVFGINSDSKLWYILFGSLWEYTNYNNPLDTGLRIKAICTNESLRKSIYKYYNKEDENSLNKLQEKIISKYPDYNVE